METEEGNRKWRKLVNGMATLSPVRPSEIEISIALVGLSRGMPKIIAHPRMLPCKESAGCLTNRLKSSAN